MKGKDDQKIRLTIAVHSVALTVQIQLQQNKTDLALREVQNARRWAQDSLLVNLAEAWVGLRIVRADRRWPYDCER